MKTHTIFSVLLLAAAITCAAQQSPEIYWRFANPIVIPVDGESFLQFDVEISCDQPGTFHTDLQVYLDYNPGAFGENVTANGNVTVEKLDLLRGDVSGTARYVQLPAGKHGVDNRHDRHACLSNAVFQVPNTNFLNIVPVFPEWGGVFRYRLRIADNTEKAGICFASFDARGVPLMEEMQYFCKETYMNPGKFSSGKDFPGLSENCLTDFPLQPAKLKSLDDTGVKVYSERNNVYIKSVETGKMRLNVYDLYGKIVFSSELSGSTEYEVSTFLATGIYIAEIQSNMAISTQKILLAD